MFFFFFFFLYFRHTSLQIQSISFKLFDFYYTKKRRANAQDKDELNTQPKSHLSRIQRRNEHPKNKSISPTLNIFNLKCSPIQNIAYLP